MKKKTFIKVCVFVILLPIAFILGWRGISLFIEYRNLNKESQEIQAKLLSPTNRDNALINASKVELVLSSIPDVNDTLLITELDATSAQLSAKRVLSLGDISSITEETILELSVESSNVKNSLAYLAGQRMAYDFIDVTDNIITMRIYVKGD